MHCSHFDFSLPYLILSQALQSLHLFPISYPFIMSLPFFLSPLPFSFFPSSFPHHSSFTFLLQALCRLSQLLRSCKCHAISRRQHPSRLLPISWSSTFFQNWTFRCSMRDTPLLKSHAEEKKSKSMLSLLTKNLSVKCCQSS